MQKKLSENVTMLHHSWDIKFFCFFHPQDCGKMHFSKQGKYFIANKSARSAPYIAFYITSPPQPILLLFTGILTIKILKVFFSEKTISGKN